MSMRRPLPVLLGALLGLTLPGPAAGQSILSGYGFGSLSEPLDARAVALGGVGVGLRGTVFSIQDPAAGSDIALPAVYFTNQTTWNDLDEGGTASSHTSSRFPSLGVAYPIRRIGVVSVSFNSVLDQNWSTSQERLLTLEGGAGTQARVTDIFDSRGGVSSVRVGVARRLGPALSIGANVGTYMGNVTRRFARTFDSLEVETDVPTFEVGGSWDYSGLVASVGASVDLPGVARIAASYTMGGDLEADPSPETLGGGLSVSMPSEFRVGGTAIFSEEFSLTGGVLLADWSSAGDALADVEGQSILRFGGGFEWSGASVLGKPSAVRLGYRSGDEPFRRAGDPEVSESAFLAGLGMNLLENAAGVLARADFALERGSRDATVFTEDFWRLSVSLRVSGF